MDDIDKATVSNTLYWIRRIESSMPKLESIPETRRVQWMATREGKIYLHIQTILNELSFLTEKYEIEE